MAKRSFHYLVLQEIFVASVLMTLVEGYTTCEGLDYEFDGYTYSTDIETSDRLWTQCSFPNPIGDHELCGRPEKTGHYYLCDPDTLIQDQNTANTIEGKLQELQTSTSTLCVSLNGQSQSFIAAIAIIDRMLIPDLQSPQLCSNECGKLLPDLNQTQRQVTNNEKRRLMTNFATNLRQTWGMGACENDVIVLYCHEFGMVKIVAGSKASKLLTEVSSLQDAFETDIREMGFENGLKEAVFEMLAEIRKSLRGTTPGHIVMYIHICTMVAFGVLLFLYVFVRDAHTDVWGVTTVWDVSDAILQFVSGIWVIKGTVLSMAFLSNTRSNYGLYVMLCGGCVAFVVCLAMYILSANAF